MSGTKLRNLARDGDQKTFMQGLASKLSPVDKKKVYALVAKNMTEEVELDEKVGRTALKLAKALVKTKGGNIRGTGLAKLEKEKAKTASLERKLDKALAGERIKKEKEKQDKINKNIQNAKQGKPQEESVEEDRKPLTIQQRVARGRVMKRLAPKMARAKKMKAKRMADPNQLKVRAQRAAIAIVRKKVAGDKGVNYANLSPSDKINVDKRVQKKSALIQKIAKKQLPKIRKKEQERLKALRGGVKTEKFNLTEEAENALRKKSKEYGISYNTLKEIFDRGMNSYATNSTMSAQQWAFARVNSFIKGGKTRTTADADLWEQHSINEAWWNDLWSKLSQMIHPKGWKVALKTYVDGMKDKEHRDHPSMWAQDVALRYNVKGLDGRHLVQYINKLVAQGKLPKELKAEYVTEEGGAGEEGTKKLLNKYKKDTPNEAYNPDEDFDEKIDKKKLKEFYLPETSELR